MNYLEDARIETIRQIRQDIWSMHLNAPIISQKALPGQFVHIRIQDDSFQPLLRRPLSLGRVNGDRIELIWRVVGLGTDLLTQKLPGDTLNLIGPLGKPFTIKEEIRDFILVSGGLGHPPISFFYDYLKKMGKNARLFHGVRSMSDLPIPNDDPQLEEMTLSTEEPSIYHRGLVTEPVQLALNILEEDHELDKAAVYACGPWGLITALQKIVPEDQIGMAEVSLEQNMGCGIGVCQGCAVKASGGPTPYRLVCHDGPVFPMFSVEAPNAI